MTTLKPHTAVESSCTPEHYATHVRAFTDTDGRIPSLDGLRALSIACVILGHLSGTRGFPSHIASVVEHLNLANIGVRVFFVISGFLITGLLLTEHAKNGTISLSRFYLRRSLRIFPAYYAYLLVVAILTATGLIVVQDSDFAHALTYTMNYAPSRGWYLGHLWSLAVEEQFYLLWPAAMVLATPRRAWWLALSVVCVVPIVRLIEGTFWYASLAHIGTFESTADAIALGCLLALWRNRLWAHNWYRRAVESSWIAPLFLVIGFAVSLRFRPGLVVGTPMVNVALVLVVDRVVRHPSGFVGRVLNAKPLVVVGALSYSIYLWQQVFLNRASGSPTAAFPLNVLLAACVAPLSYFLIERPFLAMRPRMEKAWIRPQVAKPSLEQATSL